MSQEEAEKLLTDEWQTTNELLDQSDTNRHNLLRALNKLLKYGEVLKKEIHTGRQGILTYTWKKK